MKFKLRKKDIERIKGLMVTWFCEPDHGWYGKKGFVCVGTITDVKESTFGSSKKGYGATISVCTPQYLRAFRQRRGSTFISLEKLMVANTNLTVMGWLAWPQPTVQSMKEKKHESARLV